MITAAPADAVSAIAAEPWRADLLAQYPDFLEESGEGEQAELIRVQGELAKITYKDQVCKKCKVRCGDNKAKYCAFGGDWADKNSHDWANPHQDALRRRATAILLNARTWAAPLWDALPKCERCGGDGIEVAPTGDPPCQACMRSGLAVGVEFPAWPLATISCWLAAFVGERCENCRGGEPQYARFGHGGEPCDTCSGRGYSGGLALAVPRVWPVSSWVLTGFVPVRFNAGFWAFERDNLLPESMRIQMGGKRGRSNEIRPMFDTADLATRALSRAALTLARAWSELPPWPAKEE